MFLLLNPCAVEGFWKAGTTYLGSLVTDHISIDCSKQYWKILYKTENVNNYVRFSNWYSVAVKFDKCLVLIRCCQVSVTVIRFAVVSMKLFICELIKVGSYCLIASGLLGSISSFRVLISFGTLAEDVECANKFRQCSTLFLDNDQC